MNISVLKVSEGELVGRGANVALVEGVPTEVDAVHDMGKAKHTDVELTERCVVPVGTADKDWVLDVLLNDPLLPGFLFQKCRDFIY